MTDEGGIPPFKKGVLSDEIEEVQKNTMYKFNMLYISGFIGKDNNKKGEYKMKVFVDQNGCISCGMCVGECPQVFAFDDDGKSTTLAVDVPPVFQDDVQQARDSCPASVIMIEV